MLNNEERCGTKYFFDSFTFYIYSEVNFDFIPFGKCMYFDATIMNFMANKFEKKYLDTYLIFYLGKDN